jgi:plasmid replication initiation protein
VAAPLVAQAEQWKARAQNALEIWVARSDLALAQPPARALTHTFRKSGSYPDSHCRSERSAPNLPVLLIAYDILEFEGTFQRHENRVVCRSQSVMKISA